MKTSNEQVAQTFLSMGVQSWGQTQTERDKATNAFLEATGHPLDRLWLRAKLLEMPRGNFQEELEFLLSLFPK